MLISKKTFSTALTAVLVDAVYERIVGVFKNTTFKFPVLDQRQNFACGRPSVANRNLDLFCWST